MDPATRIPLMEEQPSPDSVDKFHLFSDGSAFRSSRRVKFVRHDEGGITLHFWPAKDTWHKMKLSSTSSQRKFDMEKLTNCCPYLYFVSDTQAFDKKIKIESLERDPLSLSLILRFLGEHTILRVPESKGDKDRLYELSRALVRL